MLSLIQTSRKYKKSADKLLASSGLISILEKFGQVVFVGSYAMDLMMHGDIDIHVIRPKPFSKNEVVRIFNKIVRLTKFNSYYIGDWNDTNIHPEFPSDSYYLGLKTRFTKEKWKIDIWFVSKDEQSRLDRKAVNFLKVKLSLEQKETILQFKQYRKDHDIKISGQQIYKMVLKDGIHKINEFRKLMKMK